MKELWIIGGGAGEWDQITLKAMEQIEQAAHTAVQTAQMPLFANLTHGGIEVIALDSCYKQAEDFDALNRAVFRALCALEGTVCYVVYGSALDDCTAAYALEQAQVQNVPVHLIPGVSAAGTVLAALKRPGRVFTALAADFCDADVDLARPAIYTCVDNKLLAGTLKCALTNWYDDEQTVWFYRENERGESTVKEIPLYELDRLDASEYGHTSCVFLPAVELNDQHGYSFEDLVRIMRRLRDVNGCPWDREQTHESLKRYLLEECYEVLDAIDAENDDALCDELGDVLLQVVFHAQIGAEESSFSIYDVITAVCKKMIRRHPHIFANVKAETSEAVLQNWEAIKRQEKQLRSISETLEEIPRSMTALMRAEKACDRARKAAPPPEKEALAGQLKQAADQAGSGNPEAIGRLLFLTCLLAQQNHVQPELALNEQTDRFIRTFRPENGEVSSVPRQFSDGN